MILMPRVCLSIYLQSYAKPSEVHVTCNLHHNVVAIKSHRALTFCLFFGLQQRLQLCKNAPTYSLSGTRCNVHVQTRLLGLVVGPLVVQHKHQTQAYWRLIQALHMFVNRMLYCVCVCNQEL
ncbi:hypothetical protein ABBQ38_013087 [Trebouxia sp. C0009 RCD-2024]